MDGVETGALPSDFAQQLRCKNAVLYFTLLDAAGKSPTLFMNQICQSQREKKLGPFQKKDHQKLQRLYTQGSVAYGSVRNFVRASKLSVSKMRQFFHSKPSYIKFTLATLEFQRMKAFARCKMKFGVWT